ncbi:unnamed protein product [Schistocephalus solidus]|uniref:LTD domain-containing protein n=1 Tax=Schistocephalus solidus TaxID=70667 RepID=A0A183SUP3_SCHSO|nr:unnamed protein product [Schistocephalus solidus]
MPQNLSSFSDALVDPKKGSSSAEVDIVNYSLDGVYLVGYNQYSFVLSNGVKMYGPVAAFPKNVFSWNPTAIGTFNFLNAEERYVAAALIPPIRLDVFDTDRRILKQLADGRELRKAIAETPESGLRQLPHERNKLITSKETPPLRSSTSDKSEKV